MRQHQQPLPLPPCHKPLMVLSLLSGATSEVPGSPFLPNSLADALSHSSVTAALQAAGIKTQWLKAQAWLILAEESSPLIFCAFHKEKESGRPGDSSRAEMLTLIYLFFLATCTF